MKLLLLALALAGSASPDLKRARDRYEFGAYADCAGAVRTFLGDHGPADDGDAVEAYRLLGLCEWNLGDRAQARAAFVNLLSHDPDHVLDPFLVPPPIVEFFDKVKQEHEPELAPLREGRRQAAEHLRLAEEAKRRLLAEEQARTGPPTKVIRVQERLYLFNWLPLGAGQYQNGHHGKGTAVAAAEVALGVANLGAIVFHNQLAEDRSRRCAPSQAGCSRPPISDSDRALIYDADVVKYASAALFWAVYAYGVLDAHLNYVPRVETEISPQQGGGALKLSWSF